MWDIYIDIKLWKERAWGKERKRLGSEGGKEKWGWKVKDYDVTCMLQVISPACYIHTTVDVTCYKWHTSSLLVSVDVSFIVTWHKGFVIVTCSQNEFRFEDVFEPKNIFFWWVSIVWRGQGRGNGWEVYIFSDFHLFFFLILIIVCTAVSSAPK